MVYMAEMLSHQERSGRPVRLKQKKVVYLAPPFFRLILKKVQALREEAFRNIESKVTACLISDKAKRDLTSIPYLIITAIYKYYLLE